MSTEQRAAAQDVPTGHRAGFGIFVGRPNAGKSTLTNAMVGQKVAITSSKPQTTRHAIRGIVTRSAYQLIMVDTPGVHRPRTLLGQRLNELVEAQVAQVDVIGFCLPANEAIGPGDRFIARQLTEGGRTPVVAVVTKADTVSPERLAAQLVAVKELGEELLDGSAGSPRPGHRGWADIVPVSAVDGFQVDTVSEVLAGYLPVSPQLYSAGDVTDETAFKMVAELIREAALEGVRDELPHSLAVVVEEMAPREGRPAHRPLTDIHANLFVERPSQKAIVIGRAGSRLKDVGARARTSIQEFLGTQVFLDLRVKVAKEWQRDPKQLGRLGF